MGRKVLIVDDSLTIRQQVGSCLRQAGFDVIEAVDGLDGLARMEANRDIALVISDVNMPRLGGIEMVQRARDVLRTSAAILMLTTEAQPELIDRARKAGAKGWMVKPFKPDHLVQAARKLAGVAG